MVAAHESREASVTQLGPSTPLGRITDPTDLRRMSPAELTALAAEIREFLVEQTSKRGGHLAAPLVVYPPLRLASSRWPTSGYR